METHQHAVPATAENKKSGAQAVERDPVCGMSVGNEKSAHSVVHEGHTHRFCSTTCQERFEKHPSQYITAIDPVCGMQVERASDSADNDLMRKFAKHLHFEHQRDPDNAKLELYIVRLDLTESDSQ